jgi:hypothetical protein
MATASSHWMPTRREGAISHVSSGMRDAHSARRPSTSLFGASAKKTVLSKIEQQTQQAQFYSPPPTSSFLRIKSSLAYFLSRVSQTWLFPLS